MDYEKKYKEALELMKDCVPDEDGLVHVRPCEIFTELADSEDERIRKAILEHIRYCSESIHDRDKFVAWLEKQGKQESVTCPICGWKSEKQGGQRSKLVDFEFNANDSDLQEATYFIPKGFRAEIIGDKVVIKKGEQKPWSEEDEKKLNTTITYLLDAKDFKLTAEKCIDWLKSLKSRVGCEANCTTTQEWSEEDLVAIDSAVDALSKDLPSLAASIRRIKSLSPQYAWKPSDRQMATLEYYMHTLPSNEHKEVLFGLYEYLKKLREK